jgi:hypothetical protein
MKEKKPMKKLVISFLAVLTVFQIAFGQDRTEIKAQIKEQRQELKREQSLSKSSSSDQVQSAKINAATAVTAADVGEPDSFGKNALFLGIAQSGFVLIDPTCDPNDIGPLGPDDHCIVVADPSVPLPSTTINDVARITIPGKSVANIVYAIGNHNVSYDMFNASAGTAFGRMTYVPSVTIESSALNDPSLIDPTTGNPFNGSFTTTGIGTYSTTKTLASGATEFQALSYSRANTLGFSRTYFAGLGLPSNVIDDLYKKPMTIRLNVRVSSRWVDSATMFFTIRFLGN